MRLAPRSSLVLAAVLVAAPLAAQTPLATGTAVGLGLTGLTEARAADAGYWNPALINLFDGPSRSVSLLDVAVEPRGLRHLRTLGQALATSTDEGTRSLGASSVSFLRDIAKDGATGTGGTLPVLAGVHWAGFTAGDFGLSVTTQGYGTIRIAPQVAGVLARDAATLGATMDSATRAGIRAQASRTAIVSTATLTKGNTVGAAGGRRWLWTGITVRASMVHAATLGRFDVLSGDSLGGSSSANGLRYRQVSMSHAGIFGLDLGLVVHPTSAVLVSMVASNLVQKSLVPGDSTLLQGTSVELPGVNPTTGTADTVTVSRAAFAAGSPTSTFASDSRTLIAGAHFMPALRTGLAIETVGGRLLGAITVPLNGAPAIDRDLSDRWSVGYMMRGRISPRVSVSRRFDGARVLGGGLFLGHCGTRLALGVTRVQPRASAPLWGASIGWSSGREPCRRP